VAFRLSLKPTFPGIGVKSPVSGIDVSEPGVRLQSSGDNQERRSAMFVVHGDRCRLVGRQQAIWHLVHRRSRSWKQRRYGRHRHCIFFLIIVERPCRVSPSGELKNWTNPIEQSATGGFNALCCGQVAYENGRVTPLGKNKWSIASDASGTSVADDKFPAVPELRTPVVKPASRR
jgi:hypothetical protein